MPWIKKNPYTTSRSTVCQVVAAGTYLPWNGSLADLCWDSSGFQKVLFVADGYPYGDALGGKKRPSSHAFSFFPLGQIVCRTVFVGDSMTQFLYVKPVKRRVSTQEGEFRHSDPTYRPNRRFDRVSDTARPLAASRGVVDLEVVARLFIEVVNGDRIPEDPDRPVPSGNSSKWQPVD
jgi:hypothetical protein